ncbi:PD-(D/E)XK nuclease family protein [Rheinheimera aquimaris]|uniref:PDDEXK-like family protein n=1 Tax=Rheinheimera aquimaris TaxID=412437 RepID=UPI003A977922
METHLLKFKQLLEEFRQLQPMDVPELSIFSIGSKGYYENPTTDILAFFFDSNAQHQLGDTALKALINCLPNEYHELDTVLSEIPEREVSTKAGKRIDLLLEGNNWVMVLENKIFHQQNNPFNDYEQYVREEKKSRFGSKQAIFVVLSPNGEKPDSGWYGISYSMLISSLKAQLAERFVSQPINKWCLLLREFVIHLESLMSQPSIDKETLDFVLQNLATIRDIEQTTQQVINQYHQRLQAELQTQLKQNVAIRLNTWDGYPALRFSLSKWENNESDVVLFLSGKAEEASVNVYAVLPSSIDEQQADSIVLKNLRAKKWTERSGKIRCYSVKRAEIAESELIQFICNRLLALDELEKFSQSESA